MDPTPVAVAIATLADRYVAAYFDTFPDHATLAGVADAAHDRLPDNSADARARWEAEEDRFLAGLEGLDPHGLESGDPAALTHGFLRERLRNLRDLRIARLELWRVSPSFNGWPQRMALLAGAQPVGTPELQDAALDRFAGLPRYIEQEIENAREGLRLGYSSPRNNVEALIPQLERLLATELEASPFVAMAKEPGSSFHTRLLALESEAIRPAIARYLDFVRDEYRPAARESIGISAHPDGDAAYRATVRHYATVEMEPEEIHRLGLDQVASIRAEMAEIGRRSLGIEDVDEALRVLKTDRRYLVGSRAELLGIIEDAVARARAALPGWFGTLPRSPMVVQPVPSFSEDSAPAGYYNAPAEDGSRPGIYFVNLREAAGQPRAGLESTAFHEAYPGHHLQVALAVERTELHPVSRHFFLSGFGEGWALYSERLSDEMGLFSSDVDRMGLLSNEALRAARLVVDPGIHALGWSRQRAVDYMLAHTTESEASVAAEVNRYIAVPAQATSYMIGSVEIFRLRALARARLGDAFRLRDFHDRVLEDGAVPLAMLRAKIERWAEAEAARNGTTPGDEGE